jgi:hypothetical protein
MADVTVTADHLRRLATVDPDSMFRDADTLVLSDEGLTLVPFRVVSETLAGRTRFVHRLLCTRGELAEMGVVAGRRPRTMDGSDLDARLVVLAAELNELLAVEPEEAAK